MTTVLELDMMTGREVEETQLDEILDREGYLPVRRACQIADGVLAALEGLHARGRVHGSVEPSHIRVTDDGDGRLMPAGRRRGPVLYMSPEQLSAVSSDRRSDVFSMGQVLCEMLSGQPAMEPLDDMCPWLPKAVCEVVMRATRKNPADRFADAADFRRSLREAANGAMR